MKNFVSIHLNRRSEVPLYQQLYTHIKKMIINGSIKTNEKLPPIRKLSEMLKVNNVTVVNAYRLLEQEGLLYSKTGSGTFVGSAPEYAPDPTAGFFPPESHIEYEIPALNIMDQGRLQIPAGAVNFASATPNPELFPVEDFKNILNEVLDRDGGKAFAYQEGQGYHALRESFADYLRFKGIMLNENNVQVISGAQQGIDIMAKSLLKPGDCVITEDPTYTGAIAAFRSRGARIVPVPINSEGISLEGLESALKKYHPKLIYIIPNFHTPTGFTYSQDTKMKLLQICRENNIMIIEDDSFTELSYDSQERLPLKTLDEDQRVIFIKSFSKILMPGLRLAFLLAPSKIMPALLSAKHSSDISTPGLIQRAFDLYLRKGLWVNHIELMRKIYKDRYYIMLDTIHSCLHPDITYIDPGGGLSFWFKLPAGNSANQFYVQCLERKVIISPGSLFSASDKRDGEHFRLSFAALYPEEIKKGIIEMSRCYAEGKAALIRPGYSYSPML